MQPCAAECNPVQSISAQFSSLQPNMLQYSPVYPITVHNSPVQPSTVGKKWRWRRRNFRRLRKRRRGGEGGPNSSCSSSHKERTGEGFCPECRLLNHCNESRVNYSIKHIQKVSKRKPSNITLHISSSNPMRAEFSDF